VIIEDADLYNRVVNQPKEHVIGRLLCGRSSSEARTYNDCKYIFNGFSYWIGGGYVFSPKKDFNISGDQLRVKAIEVESDKQVLSTDYDYRKSNSALSSGATSYEPFGMLPPIISLPSGFTATEGVRMHYKAQAFKRYSPLIALAREVPAPGVMYENVTVRSSGTYNIPGSTSYQYEVFKEGMMGVSDLFSSENAVPGLSEGTIYSRIKTRGIALKDYTSRLGNLKRVITYDNNGNKLTENINRFLHDNLEGSFESNKNAYESSLATYQDQGTIHQSYVNARVVRQKDNSYHLLGMGSKRETYPTIPTGTTSINYKTGITVTSENLAFDSFSGEVTKTLNTDGYGNRFMAESRPAYTLYPAMGLKINNTTHKHMLTQEAASYVWKVNADNIAQGLVSASVQTWSNAIPFLSSDVLQTPASGASVWRKQASYSWMPVAPTNDGLTPPANPLVANAFIDFFTGDKTKDFYKVSWQKTAEVTLYNQYTAALEARDLNGNYASTKMGNKSSRVFATATLANYHEMAYSGAEEALSSGAFSGGVTVGAGSTVYATDAHTGVSSLSVPAVSNGFVYSSRYEAGKLQIGRAYRASVWVKGSGYAGARLYYKVGANTAVHSAAPEPTKQANGWYLLSFVIPAGFVSPITSPANGTTLEVGCQNTSGNTLYFDDFRVQPLQASMTAYVYDPFSGELTHILDNNNLFTRYEYDAAGRLVKTYRETFGHGVKPVSEHRYHYARKVN